jgi:hypothetical protein
MTMNAFVWIKKNKVASFLIISVFVVVGIKAFNIGVQVAKDEIGLRSAITFLSTYFVFICLLFVCWVLGARVRRSQRQIDWLIDATNWNIRRLNTAQSGQADATGSIDKPAITDSRWPWGKHHTETLGHLEAAARKWWVLYDPSDFTTAPTNEMVSEWLQTERGISKEKARAIASMLRPDGLPTGPRR